MSAVGKVVKKQKPSRQKKKSFWAKYWLFILGGLSIVIVACTVFFGSAYLAYKSFWRRLELSKSASFTGNLEFYGQDFLTAYDSKMSFNGTYQKSPSDSLDLDLNFDGIWAKKAYTGQAKKRADQGYFMLSGSELPVLRYRQSPILVPLTTQWYTTKFATPNLNFVCENSSPAAQPQPLALYRLIKNTHASVWRANPWGTRDGHLAAYFGGSVDTTHFGDILDATKSLLPAGCDLNTFGFTAGDAKKLVMHYELWAAKGSDVLRVTLEDKVLGSRLIFNISLASYNTSTLGATPATATSLDTIRANLEPQWLAKYAAEH